MNPAIRAVAAETGATVVDVSAAFPNRLELLPDGLHPTAAGVDEMVRRSLPAVETFLSRLGVRPAGAS